MAYTSNETGRMEIYVEPYPGPGHRWQVSKHVGASLRGLGIPQAATSEGVDADVSAVFEAALATFESLGIATEEVALPASEHAVACYYNRKTFRRVDAVTAGPCVSESDGLPPTDTLYRGNCVSDGWVLSSVRTEDVRKN